MGLRVEICIVKLIILCIMGEIWLCCVVGMYMVCTVGSGEQISRGFFNLGRLGLCNIDVYVIGELTYKVGCFIHIFISKGTDKIRISVIFS